MVVTRSSEAFSKIDTSLGAFDLFKALQCNLFIHRQQLVSLTCALSLNSKSELFGVRLMKQ